MKIAYNYQIIMQLYGGISRYFSKCAEHIANQGESVRFFAPLYQNNYLKEMPRGVVYGRKLNSYPHQMTRFINMFNHYAANWQISQWNPDIVHETYYYSKLSKPRKCPTVVTVFDMIHELFPEWFSPEDATSQRKRLTLYRADHILSISNNTKNDLVRLLNIPEDKITVVHLGFESVSHLQENDNSNFRTIEKPYLLYVGTRRGYKNFSGFLSAVASSEKLKNNFDVVAFGGGFFTDQEREMMDKLGFKNDQAHQVGGDDIMLGRLYKHASAFVYPSLYEGFGLPPLEAMAYDCPVVSSNTSSMPEVIGAAAEYFDPRNNEEMKNAIEKVVFSKDYSVKLKVLGKDRLNLFSWEKCATETLEVYRRLVNK